ncbi:MAG: DUF4290 domain-containing protein [Bacteroidales bacterium]|nr:DUF4290 domain-containing protein [Bacteroidales bacterium]
MTYNTQLKKLVLPEYGRNIQQMVNHCLSISDKEERTRCAYSIINTMGNLFPNLRDVEEFRHKLWDHLAIMSDFKLDIDYPFEVITADNINKIPNRLEYHSGTIKLRHYGKYMELMIVKASLLDDGEEKDKLVSLIANHMKKMLLSENSDSADDAKVFKDLYEYSKGKINLNPETYHLHDFKDVSNVSGKKKKRNRQVK